MVLGNLRLGEVGVGGWDFKNSEKSKKESNKERRGVRSYPPGGCSFPPLPFVVYIGNGAKNPQISL